MFRRDYHRFPFTTGLFPGILLWLFAAASSPTGVTASECPDWYQTAPVCDSLRIRLKADTSQNICGEMIEQLRGKKEDLNSLVTLSLCLQEVAPPSKLEFYKKSMGETSRPDESWFLARLKDYRIQKAYSGGLDLAYLAEFLYPGSLPVRRELNEIYRLSSSFYASGISSLHWLNLDTKRAQSVKYSLDNLLRTADIEITPAQMLDTLLGTFSDHTIFTLRLLGELCWKYKNYEGLLGSFLGGIKTGDMEWREAEGGLQKFISIGYYDYANLILDACRAENNVMIPKNAGERYFTLINYHLKNWGLIIGASNPALPEKKLGWEQRLYLASALARFRGADADSLKTCRRLSYEITENIIQKAPSPWNYRAVFVQVENLIGNGRFTQASKLLEKEKNNPERKEGSGTILFWDAVVSIYGNKYREADSLLMLASAYHEEANARRALELRRWLILDTSGTVRRYFFNGLTESPRPEKAKALSLDSVPVSSPLWPYARLERFTLLKRAGKIDQAKHLLKELKEKAGDEWISRFAGTQLNFIMEKEQTHDKSLAIYDQILLKYQQGIISEFIRERIRVINNQ